MTRARPIAVALALAASLSVGCTTELESGLTEAQADEIVLALDATGIGSEKARVGTGYSVRVGRDEVAAALAAMQAAGVPREAEPGVDAVFDGSSLVESPTAERARYAAALAADLSRTIEAIDGVERAHVHLALTGPGALDVAPPPPRASVLVTVTEGGRVDADDVRRLVVGAVEGLAEDAVEVVRTSAPRPESDPVALRPVGPFAVRADHASALKVVLGASFALNLVLVVLLLVRRRRARAAAEAVHER
ncbi:MAG: hypothetical protein AB7S26_15170 [Sandaracinaceae bacterium]